MIKISEKRYHDYIVDINSESVWLTAQVVRKFCAENNIFMVGKLKAYHDYVIISGKKFLVPEPFTDWNEDQCEKAKTLHVNMTAKTLSEAINSLK